jgi:serine/threonine-protein kinase
MWLLYVGLEPFVRRRWPHTLIGWSRLLMGRFTDPLVGRDVLAGASGGLVLAALAMLTTLALNTSGRASGLAHLPSLWALAGTRDILGFFGFCVFQAVLNALGLLFLLFMFRLVLRRDWLMALGFVVLLSTRIAGNDPTGVAINFAFQVAWALVIVAILTRFGLLAFAVAWAFERVLEMTPLTTDLSAWHAGPTVAGLVVLIALAAVAVKVALAGKSMLGVGLEGE